MASANGRSAPDESFNFHSLPPPCNQLSDPIETKDIESWTESYSGSGDLSESFPDANTDENILIRHEISPAQNVVNPLDKAREFRDRYFLFAFGFCLLFMVGVGIFALSTGTFHIMQRREGCPSYWFTRRSLLSDSKQNFGRLRRSVADADTSKDFELTRDADDNPNSSALNPKSLLLNSYSLEQKARVVDVPVDILMVLFVSMTFIALGFSIVMTILLKQFAGPIVWGVIFLCVFMVVVVCVVSWVVFFVVGNMVLLIIALVTTITTIVLLLVIKVMKKRIQMVVRLFKEAGKAIQAVPLIVAQPVLTFLFLLFTFIMYAVLGTLLETSLIRDSNTGTCWKPGFASASRWVNIFAFFWVTQFLIGCQHMVVASVITKWFFTRDKNQLDSPLLSSWRNTIRFHLGSVAFASLVTAFVKFIRLLIKLMSRGMQKIFPKCFSSLIFACCECILDPVERFLVFLNRNAYVEIAIHGDGYLKSARRAFEVIVSNVPTLATINSIGDFVLFLGKVTVTGLTFLCGFFIAKANLEFNPNLISSPPVVVVLIIGTVFGLLISHCFLSVYEMAMDTIFVCFCEDLEMNDGLIQPYFMSKKLMEFIQSDK